MWPFRAVILVVINYSMLMKDIRTPTHDTRTLPQLLALRATDATNATVHVLYLDTIIQVTLRFLRRGRAMVRLASFVHLWTE